MKLTVCKSLACAVSLWAFCFGLRLPDWPTVLVQARATGVCLLSLQSPILIVQAMGQPNLQA